MSNRAQITTATAAQIAFYDQYDYDMDPFTEPS